MLLVLLLVLFTSLSFSLVSSMTLLHHQSIKNYTKSKSLDALAQGAKELSAEHLAKEWVSCFDSGWTYWDEIRQFRYIITTKSEEERSIKVLVKDEKVERTFQGLIVRKEVPRNLLSMTDYGVYATEDLLLSNLATISSIPPLVGVAALKNVKISSETAFHRLNLHVNGNIYVESVYWETFHNYSVVSSSPIPVYDVNLINEIIDLLKNWFSDKMVIEGNQYSLNVNLDAFAQGCDILVLEGLKELRICGTFHGILIVRDCESTTFENANVNGMTIISGSNVSSMENTCFTGALGLVESSCLTSFDFHLDHDLDVLAPLQEYLSMEFASPSAHKQLYIQGFKEIH